jgi:hypothetical protein
MLDLIASRRLCRMMGRRDLIHFLMSEGGRPMRVAIGVSKMLQSLARTWDLYSVEVMEFMFKLLKATCGTFAVTEGP